MPIQFPNASMLARAPDITPPLTYQQQQQNALGDINLQKEQQGLETQNAMKQIFAQPGALGQDGIPTPQTLNALYAINPEVGARVGTLAESARHRKVQEQEWIAQAQERRQKTMMDSAAKVLTFYERALQNTGDDAKARQQTDVYVGELHDEMSKSDSTLGPRPGPFEPDKWYANVQSAQMRAAEKAARLKADENNLMLRDGKGNLFSINKAGHGGIQMYDYPSRTFVDFGGTLPVDALPIAQPTVQVVQQQAEARAAGTAAGKPDTSTVPGDDTKTGEDYLKTLPKGQADTVRGVAEGRINMNTFSTRGGHREQIQAMVMQYDPTYNATRPATWREFTTGATAKNITSINTALSHMDTMYDLADAMKNKDVRVVNTVLNRLATETGKPEITNFEVARIAVGDELMRTFRQVGASEKEAEAWQQRFATSNSPEQLKQSVAVAGDLLKGRLDAVNDQWKRGTQLTTDFPDIVSKKNRGVMEKIRSGTKSESGEPKRITSDAEYDALPKGALFIAPGETRARKKP